MVEMLAVLALIGVLSVAGLAGWKMAMTRHYTNILFNEAQKRATIISGQIGAGQTPSLSGFTDNETSAGTFGTNVVMLEDGAQFGIPVSGVEKSVCENLLKMTGTTEESIQRLSQTLSPETPFTVCSDENSFLMVYDNVMRTNKECTKDTDCETVCGVCSDHGFCINECEAEDVECTKATEKTDCKGSCVGCVVASGETKGTCQSCTPVEYLESVGGSSTHKIDTGILGNNNNLQIEIKFNLLAYLQWGGLFGCYRSTGTSTEKENTNVWRIIQRNVNNTTMYVYPHVRANSPVKMKKANLNVINVTKNAVHTIRYNRSSITVDGNTDTYVTPFTTGTTNTDSIYLFSAGKSNSASKLRVYSFKIWDNGTLVRDFVPVLDWNDVPAMYDRVTNEVFRKTGAGKFGTNLEPATSS